MLARSTSESLVTVLCEADWTGWESDSICATIKQRVKALFTSSAKVRTIHYLTEKGNCVHLALPTSTLRPSLLDIRYDHSRPFLSSGAQEHQSKLHSRVQASQPAIWEREFILPVFVKPGECCFAATNILAEVSKNYKRYNDSVRLVTILSQCVTEYLQIWKGTCTVMCWEQNDTKWVTCAILVFFCWNWQSLSILAPDCSLNCWWKGCSSWTVSPKLDEDGRKEEWLIPLYSKGTGFPSMFGCLCSIVEIHRVLKPET